MFGIGIALMHIADYLTRRKYDKKEKMGGAKLERPIEKEQCDVCGNHFGSEGELRDHMEIHHTNTS
jgi:hypothetical protein